MAVWTFSDWVESLAGNPLRLSRLRSHIKEVSDKIADGDNSTEGDAHSFGYLQTYLTELHRKEEKEADSNQQAAGKRTSFTRGFPIR